VRPPAFARFANSARHAALLSLTRRIASICIGAFILGEAGLLDDRRATAHWQFAGELRRRYPKATVEMGRIFIALIA
jgi:transcriptional regulator GlxA family with amidase domain